MGSESFLSSAFSRQRIVTAAGIAAAAFIGYCIYFDHKRRSAPDYKQKIREQRRATAKKKQPTSLPNPHNATEMQAFFLQEVQLGEELLADGHTDEGIEHLCNAITLCGQPSQLIQIFEQTLPGEHFTLLVQKLPEAKIRLMRMFGDHLGQVERSHAGAEDGEIPTVVAAPSAIEISDDLELE
ncbi:MAS20 protein import receptor containing protein [Loa loa]|uniref:MAS20 protein import receptor containing protein n=1 Tax=Loa loa TaxID=7209 RepID=A0A1I7VIY4_LOALO|nr:MAS20 protein import receptor containing protein [Loa loa]EFO21141.1 MAS20 protein import receptor containing protein [Loa loa]